MKINNKDLCLTLTLILLSVSFVDFLLYYLSTYIIYFSPFSYISFYFSELVSSIMPIIISVALLFVYAAGGLKKSFLFALIFVSPRIFYLFPYYSFEYAYLGYVTGEVFLLALIETVFSVIILYLTVMLLLLLIVFTSSKFAKTAFSDIESFKKLFSETSLFDFSAPVTVGVFLASFAVFFKNIVFEIIDTVNFFISYIDTFQIGEILYIIFRFVFILITLFISHALAYLEKNKLMRFVNGNHGKQL